MFLWEEILNFLRKVEYSGYTDIFQATWISMCFIKFPCLFFFFTFLGDIVKTVFCKS